MECLDAGWPGEFIEDKCVPFDSAISNSCGANQQQCHSLLFGEKVCIDTNSSNKNSNIECLSKLSKTDNAQQIVQNLINSPSQFEEIYQDIQIICDEDFGDEQNFIYCEEMTDYLFDLGDQLNAAKDITRAENPLEDLITDLEKIADFVNGGEPDDGLSDIPVEEMDNVQRLRVEDGKRVSTGLPLTPEEQDMSVFTGICNIENRDRAKKGPPLDILEKSVQVLENALDSSETKLTDKRKIYCTLDSYYNEAELFDSLFELFLKMPPGENFCLDSP